MKLRDTMGVNNGKGGLGNSVDSKHWVDDRSYFATSDESTDV